MSKTTVSLSAVLVALVGCVPAAGVGFSTTTSSPGPYAAPRSPAPTRVAVESSYGPGEDRHWFSDDDYLVAAQPYKGALQRGLHVAKMIAAPTADTKSEAQFLLAIGKESWSSSYFRTRIATQADLAVGAPAFCRAGWQDNAHAPRSKHEARQTSWLMAPITDNADLYKGRVTVGSVSCEVDGVRVPL